ncbi:Bud site selection protein 7 [Porphyridium purpureum]|uniref:Bud site selection protein 7 n=1 Tax=Porphyridium purpureum TaxID=35688 RepID=A0A5J4YNJ4_PORPP|nr:Bud site selection protein 7 [Porphyridium purpureum]|eukprot:POR9848..scf222_8
MGGRRESLYGIQEMLDLAERPAELSRTSRMGGFGDMRLGGPPDMVVLSKCWRPSAFAVKTGAVKDADAATVVKNTLHFVLGMDTSSPASISSYLAQLISAGLEKCDCASWNVACTHRWTIERAVFRMYLVLRKCDLVASITLPGALHFYLQDADGEETPVSSTDTALWQEAHMSSSLRFLLRAGLEPTCYPCLRVNAMCDLTTSVRAELAFFESLFSLTSEWYLAGSNVDPAGILIHTSRKVSAQDATNFDSNAPRDLPKPANPNIPICCFAATSRIAIELNEHLFEHGRYEHIIALFSSTQNTAEMEPGSEHPNGPDGRRAELVALRIRLGYVERHPDLAIFAALAREQIGDLDGAWSEICSALNALPCSPIATVFRAHFVERHLAYLKLILTERHESGSELPCLYPAELLNPLMEIEQYASCPYVCISRAELVFREKRESGDIKEDEETKVRKRAKRALVALNSTVLEPPKLDLFLRDLMRGRKYAPEPVHGCADGSDLERVLADRLRAEKLGKVNRRGRTPDAQLADISARILTDEERRAYAVLGTIVATCGWTTFLSIRSSTFIMANEDQQDETEDDENSGRIEDGSVSADTGKIVCQAWLDYLIGGMYEDLDVFAAWRREDLILLESHGNDYASTAPVAETGGASNGAPAHSEQPDPTPVLSSAPSIDSVVPEALSSVVISSTSEVAMPSRAMRLCALSSRPVVDWLRRADLAKRLCEVEAALDAIRTASRVSLHVEHEESLYSLLFILEYYQEDKASPTYMFRVLERIMTWLDGIAATQRKTNISRTNSGNGGSGAEFPSLVNDKDEAYGRALSSRSKEYPENHILGPVLMCMRKAVIRSVLAGGLAGVQQALGQTSFRNDEHKLRMASILEDVVFNRIHGFQV